MAYAFEDTPEFWKSLAHRFVRGCHKKRGVPFWASVSSASGHGSTYSADLCRYFGVDPDTGGEAPTGRTNAEEEKSATIE